MSDKKIDKKNQVEVEKLQQLIEELKAQVVEYKSKYLRALADYQNYEKRVSLEKNELRTSAYGELILKLLPFLDHLSQAEIFIKDKGLAMIKESFIKTLMSSGLEEIQVLGLEYDPYVAEVVEVVAGDRDNVVVEELRKGYRYNSKVLRVAQVKVSKKIEPNNLEVKQ